jgi:ABC-type amino acid transport system permease subunit
MAHGAGLMLVPIFLGICKADDLDAGHQAAGSLMAGNVGTAFVVATVHTLAMTAAGGLIAAIIYFWLGLKFLSSTWFNLDVVWALSLILVGAFGVFSAL